MATIYTPQSHARTGIIYKVINKVNGKVYIGQTICSLKVRQKRHLFEASRKDRLSYNQHFYRAIRKYGLENFEWSIIYSDILEDQLDLAEICAIYLYESFGPAGYNLTAGGLGSRGFRHTEEQKHKISLAHIGNKYNLNHPHSEETRLGMSLNRRGKNNPHYRNGKYCNNRICNNCGVPVSVMANKCLKCSNTELAHRPKKKKSAPRKKI